VTTAPNVEWVVKISKQCNLRCSYCYEFPFLADRARMSLEDLKAMFANIADFYANDPARMEFVWHGGEPLLIEPDYYYRIQELQVSELGERGIPFTNSIQTNLTRLTPPILAFLKSGVLDNIGVSLDLFGDQRVNVAGRPSQPTVLKNMQRLVDEGVSFGCITVLSQLTAPHVDAIYHFFEDIDTSFRLLPIYRTGYEHQQEDLALTDAEIVDAFKRMVDLWLASDRSIHVRPIRDYFANVVGKMTTSRRDSFYDKWSNEVVYIVQPDGSLYSVADPPDESLCHGNIFERTLGELKQSPGYRRAATAAAARMREACSDCAYYGVCSGFFMGEATPEQRQTRVGGKLRCGVAQPVQEYIETILIDNDVFGRLAAGRAVGLSDVVEAQKPEPAAGETEGSEAPSNPRGRRAAARPASAGSAVGPS